MNYQYPKHFSYPEGEALYFQAHIQNWLSKMPDLIGKPNVTIEVGALFGGASVFILDTYCSSPGSHHHIVDINTNEFIEKNISPYKNVSYHLGESGKILRSLNHGGKTESFADFAYIDGNHMAKFVLEDAVNCFYLVKDGGYIVFDDYGWGQNDPEHCRPATGIEAFMHAYDKYVEVIDVGWQVIMRKTGYQLTDGEKQSNYYSDWKFTTKTALS